MMRKDIIKKIAASGITASLIVLIFFVLTPPSVTGVYLHPGAPSSTSVTTATTITFNNVNLTIRGPETIPVNFLNFSIRQSSNNQEVAYVKFSITGTETLDSPIGKFTVTPITSTASLPYDPTGTYGYDERTGVNTTFGYGYGYGTTHAALTILYRITYTTHTPGTFYAQLFVNSTTHTFASGLKQTFTVSPPSTPVTPSGEYPTADANGPYTAAVGAIIQFDGSESTAVYGTIISSYTWVFGDGTTSVGIKPTHIYLKAGTYTVKLTVLDNTGAIDTDTTTATISAIAPPPPSIKVTNQTLQAINSAFGLTLATQFYASDTNGDGIVDVFTDPNNRLTPVGFVNMSGHACFLLSSNGDNIPEFFWDTATNTMTRITYTPAPLTTPFIDTAGKIVIIEISVNKTGWIYIEITDKYPIDEYPQYTFTVKAGDRVISSDRIWRKDGKVYILDDPAIYYDLIYGYTILPPTFSPLMGATVTTGQPTITITYPHEVFMTTAFLDATSIAYKLVTLDNKVFTYTPTTDLTAGSHTLSVTVTDDQGRYNLTSSSTFIVSLPAAPPAEFPAWIIVVIIAIIIILIVGVILLRRYAFI